jgi:CBS domain-containing protein
VGSLVVSEARRPVGIVTDRDLAVRVVAEGRDPAKTPVSEVMSGYPVFAARDRTVADVLSAMQNLTVRRMPIVDEDGLLIGLVSLDDVILFLAEKFGEVAATIRKEIGGV